jgi:outer membrane protein TolC
MLAVVWLGFLLTHGWAQYSPFPAPGGGVVPFKQGSPFPAVEFKAPAGQVPAASVLQPTLPAPANPRMTVPALPTAVLPRAQEAVGQPTPLPGTGPAGTRLTLEEAKQRALDNNKLLNLAALNAESKAYAIKAARADYFPKISANALYFHFNDDLGTVLSVRSKTLSAPRGRPLVTFPGSTAAVAVLNQDTSFTQIGVVQPLTDMLKIRQGVKIAQADEQIARAQWAKGVRDVASGVEQLYWGLLAVRKLQAGAQEGVREAEAMAKTKTVEARLALVEAQQGLQQVNKQVDDLQEQLNGLLDLPLCTTLELVEPALPALPFRCADEVIQLALSASPEITEAQQTVAKAQAAVEAGKLDYLPSIGLVGGYVNQTAASYIQPNIGYIGVAGTWTLFNGGKRRDVVLERKTLVAMAHLKLQQTEDEVRQKALKAYRELGESQEALKTAQEMVVLRREAEKSAATPALLMAAAKARMQAEVDAVKADLAYRVAVVQVMSMAGRQ